MNLWRELNLRLAEQITAYFTTHQQQLSLVCPPFIVEGGERTKNSYFTFPEIHSQIERHHIDRHSYVIAIGGGALLDMVGLAAATAHRGVPSLSASLLQRSVRTILVLGKKWHQRFW